MVCVMVSLSSFGCCITVWFVYKIVGIMLVSAVYPFCNKRSLPQGEAIIMQNYYAHVSLSNVMTSSHTAPV